MNRESSLEEEEEADLYNSVVEPFSPSGSPEKSSCASLSNAISLVNRYCAKLPSDTFTKLTPLCTINERLAEDGTKLYSCTVRLPINSPVKQTITVILIDYLPIFCNCSFVYLLNYNFWLKQYCSISSGPSCTKQNISPPFNSTADSTCSSRLIRT